MSAVWRFSRPVVLAAALAALAVVPGPAPANPPTKPGLAGLTERAVLAGGTLEHGVRADGSFAVEARLPWLT